MIWVSSVFERLSKAIRGNHPSISPASTESKADIDRWMQNGLASYSKGDLGQAEEWFRRVLEARPGYPDALHRLEETVGRQRKPSEAIGLFRDAMAARVSPAELAFSLGCALVSEERLEEAAAAFRQAVALDRTLSNAYDHLGCVLEQLGDRTGAIAAFDSALRIDPECVRAHCNRALQLISLGDYIRGWQEIEWRWERPEFQTMRNMFSQAWWDGSELAGKTILLFAEQGFGDAIQFIRYAPVVARTGARVVIDCHPQLKGLFRQITGVTHVLESDAEIARYDLCCPLMSLPRLLGTTLNTVPAEVPYLAPSPDYVTKWREQMRASAETVRVGLVWACNPEAEFAWRRSIALDMFAPLAQIRGVTFFSLQIGSSFKNSADLVPDLNMIDMTEGLYDFSDTAGFISNLDLVISVDTVFAHLAGALGKPTWTLLASYADWRWGTEGEASPWYPTMRLFRQRIEGEWNGVIEQLSASLHAFVKSHHATRR